MQAGSAAREEETLEYAVSLVSSEPKIKERHTV